MEYLNILNIKEIIIKKSNQKSYDFYYVQKSLIIRNIYSFFEQHKLIKKFKKILYKKYNLKKKKLAKYVIYQRKKGYRKIYNINELLNQLKINFKNINWEINNDRIFNLYNLINYWNSIKMLISIQGSNIQNTIYMNSKSGCLIINTGTYDKYWIIISIISKYFVINDIQSHLKQFSKLYQFLNIKPIIRKVKLLIFALKYNKWKEPKFLSYDYLVNIERRLNNVINELKSKYLFLKINGINFLYNNNTNIIFKKFLDKIILLYK